MEITASHRFLRVSPRKVALVADIVRGLPARIAAEQLTAQPKQASEPLLKTLQSAIANAKQNFQLDEATLMVKAIHVTQGPVLKRYRPRAFGRAAMIRKRTSHVTVILEGRSAPTEKPKVIRKKESAPAKKTETKK